MNLYWCDNCNARKHDWCTDSVRVFDTEDGPNNYVCDCYCARERRRKRDQQWEIDRFIRRHGTVLVGERLAALDSPSHRETAGTDEEGT